MRALVLHREEERSDGAGGVRASVETASPVSAGPVEVAVRYSSVNYKDGLAVTGRGKVVRGEFPFVAGIDLVGEVVSSDDDRFAKGDVVVGTGGGLGETIWGGYAERAFPDPEYLVRLPSAIDPVHAMAVGTAGVTAMLSVLALDSGRASRAGEVLVTGASGGVGSWAVGLLAASGYRIAASTGSSDAHEYLKHLGAHAIIHRDELASGPARPLDSAVWSGAVDTVGGATLAAVISRIGRHGTIVACGNAGGHEFTSSVFPFILRGVRLMGIDSNTSPAEERTRVWSRLAELIPRLPVDDMFNIISLADVPDAAERILRGDVRGRLVVDVNA